MIYYKCDSCGEGMEAPESIVGDSLLCPGCGCSVIVPAEEERAVREAVLPRWAIIVIVAAFLGAGGIVGWVVHSHKKGDAQVAVETVEPISEGGIEKQPRVTMEEKMSLVAEDCIFKPVLELSEEEREVV